MAIVADLIWDSEETEPTFQLEAFLNDLGDALSITDSEIAIRVVDDGDMQALNAQYRDKDQVTDVISFPPAWPEPSETGPRHLGDILICWAQTCRQAEELDQPVEVEFYFLVLHGVLHLLGFDHETDDGEMIQRQSELKKQLESYFG